MPILKQEQSLLTYHIVFKSVTIRCYLQPF